MRLFHLVESLRQDHALLSGELAVLKKAEVHDSSHLWQVLQNACTRLRVGLRDHIQREELVLADQTLPTGEGVDHYSDYRYLQVISRYVSSESRPFLLNSRYQLFTEFLHGLHDRMRRQEEVLFPAIEQRTARLTTEPVINEKCSQ